MATIAPSGAGDQPAIAKNDGGTLLHAGNVSEDNPITRNIPISDLADNFGDDYGSKVIAKVDGGLYSDRVGISGVSPEAVISGETELGYQSDSQEWVMNGGNVTQTLGGKPYTGLAGGAAGPDATRKSPYLLQSTRSYGDVSVDLYAMPSSGFNAWVSRTGDGELVSYIDPAVVGGETPSNDSSSAVPGELTYMFGGANPKTDDYKASGEPQEPVVPESHIIILAGQSNMVGRPAFDGGTVHPEIVIQYNQAGQFVPATNPLDHIDPQLGDMGLDIAFTQDYLANNPNVYELILVPCADGGTGFNNSNWNPGDSLYEAMVTRVNEVVAAKPASIVKAFLWHQGESDRSNNTTYVSDWRAMIADATARINGLTEETPVVVGGLYDAGSQFRDMSQLLAGIAQARAYTVFADASDLTSFDNLHFDSASLRTLGSRYAAGVESAKIKSSVAEVDSQAHWLFGSDNPTNADLVSGLIATGTPSVINSNSVLLGGALQGLDSQIQDAAQQSVFGFVRNPSSVVSVMFGTLMPFPSDAGVAALVNTPGDWRANNRDGSMGLQTLLNDTTNTEFVFIGWSFDSVAGEGIYYAGTQGGSFTYTESGATITTSQRTQAIGNLYYDSPGFEGDTEVGEFMIFPRYLTLAEIEEVYQRSLLRLLGREIPPSEIL